MANAMSKPDPYEMSQPTGDLMQRAGLALMRLDLRLVPQRALQDARDYLEEAGKQFNGRLLVEFCLEGRAADGEQALRSALLSIRSRLVGEMLHERGPRGRPSFFVRFGATMTAKVVFFLVQTVVIVLLLFLLERNWPSLNIYELGDRFLSLFR